MNDLSTQLLGSDQNVLVVSVPAEVNHETAEPLRELVNRLLPNRDGAALVLDFARVDLVSSIGIAALLQIQEACRDRDAAMSLANVSRKQVEFFRMLTIERKFHMESSVADAVSWVERQG